jgi:hypothetical protein
LIGAALARGGLGFFIIGISSAAHRDSIGMVVIQLAGALFFGWLARRRHAGHAAPMLPIDHVPAAVVCTVGGDP